MNAPVHSTLTPRGTPLSKLPRGRTRAQERSKRLADAERHLRDVYRLVDRRDGWRCRVCGRRCSPTAISMTERAERHHLVYRARGGQDSRDNLVTLCFGCHWDVHVLGVLRLSGNAEQVDFRGSFNGVRVDRLVHDVWTVIGWV